jgi:hypothetical protein
MKLSRKVREGDEDYIYTASHFHSFHCQAKEHSTCTKLWLKSLSLKILPSHATCSIYTRKRGLCPGFLLRGQQFDASFTVKACLAVISLVRSLRDDNLSCSLQNPHKEGTWIYKRRTSSSSRAPYMAPREQAFQRPVNRSVFIRR